MSVFREHRIGVSVVIPSHNTRELTERCVVSVLAQEAEVEVVVVDDASQDRTPDFIAARFPEVRIVRQAERSGFARTVNRGLAIARGEVLVALNSDTELTPGALRGLLARFAQNSQLGVAGGSLVYPDGRPQWSGGRAPSLLWLFGLSSGLAQLVSRSLRGSRPRLIGSSVGRRRVDWVTGAALAMRRAVLEQVGPFATQYRFYAQDLDFCLRAGAAGWQVEIVPEFLVVHHHGATIGKGHGAVGPQDPTLLWEDLVHWARLHHGDRMARRAASVIRLGGRLRLAGRSLRALGLRGDSRLAWRRDSLAFRRALEASSRESNATTSTREPDVKL